MRSPFLRFTLARWLAVSLVGGLTPMLARAGADIPTTKQSVGAKGGVFNCGPWSFTIPTGTVPDGGLIHCGGFNPNVAPPAPANTLLARNTINVNIYKDATNWVDKFNPAVTVCFPIGSAEIAIARGDPHNLVIASAAVSDTWKLLTTTLSDSKVCAPMSDHSTTLFDLVVPNTFSDYTVRPDDTLADIARWFKTTVAALQSVNGLSSANILVGMTLKLPSGNLPLAPVLVAPSAPGGFYTVQMGDTLFFIGKRFGDSVAALKAANKLKGDRIDPGQVLIILSAIAAAPKITVVPPAPTITPAPITGTRTYIVVRGDTLFFIAQRFGTTVAALQALNKITGSLIYPGQVLIIPGK